MRPIEISQFDLSEAREYWKAFIAGRPDIRVQDPQIHLQEFLAFPDQEKRAYLAYKQGERIVGTVRLGQWSLTEDPYAITTFSLHPDYRRYSREAILLASEFLQRQGAKRVVAGIDASYLPDFQRAGFQVAFSRMNMEADLQARRPPNVDFRHPSRDDVENLASFLRQAYDGHMDQKFGMHVGPAEAWKEYLEALLDECYLPATWLSMDPKGIAGTCIVSLGDIPFVSELGVRQDRRRIGLGRDLTIASMNALLNEGYKKLALVVTVGNDPAIRLYESLGFKETGSRLVGALLKL